MTKIEKPKNWFVKLFTFGNTFNSKNFSDNFKKYLIEFLGLFAVVTFSFYVESVGDEYEKKNRYKEIVSSIPIKIKKSIKYSEDFLELSNQISSTNKSILKKWNVNNDSIFITKFENKEYYPPLAYFFLTQEYDPPILDFDLFKSGDQEFKMLYTDISDEINQLIDGNQLNFILNIIEQQKQLTIKYKELIYEDFGSNYDITNLYGVNFWINNRKKFQKNYKFKFLVNEKTRLISDIINPQVNDYKIFLERKLSFFDSINRLFEKEKYFLYWKLN